MVIVGKDTIKYLLLISALSAALLLSACDMAAPTEGPPTAGTPAAASNTVVAKASKAVVPAVSGATPPAGASGVISGTGITPAALTFNTYTSVTGTWSMDYPQYWDVTKTADGVAFSPPGDAVTRVIAASRPATSTIALAVLPQQLGSELQQRYGASYKEVVHEIHEKAAHVNFTATVAGAVVDGDAFAEQRGNVLYLFTFLGKTGDTTYFNIFSLIFNSIKLPNDTGGTSGVGAPNAATPSAPGVVGTSGAASSTPDTSMSTPGTGSPQPAASTTPPALP